MWNARLEESQAGINIAGRNINKLRYADDPSLVAQLVKNPPAMRETWVQSLGWEDPLDADDTTLMAHSKEELKNLLMMVKKESEKAGLRLNIKKKTKIMVSGPITLWQIEGEKVETVTDFIFWAPKLMQMVTEVMKLKDTYSLEEKLWPN